MDKDMDKNKDMKLIHFFYLILSLLIFNSCGYYNAKISAESTSSSSTESNGVISTPPGNFNITATTPGNQQVTLAWSSSNDATHYVVKYGTSPGSYDITASNNATSPHTITGLNNGTTYYFMVQAINSNNTTTNNFRNASSETITIPALLPSTPLPTLDITNPFHWDLSWSTSTGTPPITYTVSRTLTYGSGYVDIPICISLGVTSCSDTTITPDSTYCYKVTASNAGGNSSSAEICPPLSAPQTLTLTTNKNITIPSFGGAPPLTYSIDSGAGVIDSQTGVFTTSSSGATSVKITDAKNNIQTISVNNIKYRLNGQVNAMVQAGNSLYVGGTFSNFNVDSASSLYSINASTGNPNYACDIQSGFNGIVYATLPTSTALFVGGNFTLYKGQSANFIAKLNLPNCDLDTTFNPPANNGFNDVVETIAVSGSSLYVGGWFTAYKSIAGSAYKIAKLDINSGEIDTIFNPPANNGFNNPVISIEVANSSLYVGGNFTSYRGIANAANKLAKLDLTTGAIDTTFSPVGATSNGFNGSVYALAASGSSLYVGGYFSAYKGIANSANNIAKLDLITGELDSTFSPVGATINGFNDEVDALTISGSSLYVGGYFTAYKGIANSANCIAKLDLNTGAIDPTFSPVGTTSNGFDGGISALATSGSSLYVGGYFFSYKGITFSSNMIAKLDLITGELDSTFSPLKNNGFDNMVYTISSYGSNIFVGGQFSIYKKSSASAKNLAKFDLTTGELDTTFIPPSSNGFNGTVNALAISGTSLYVGGNFTAYKDIADSANRLAKLDLTTGAIDTVFSPVGATSNGFDATVNALAVSGTSLYVGGNFTAYKGIADSANRLAKLDLTTGAIDTVFSPVGATSNGFNLIVDSLFIYGTNLFVGGGFTAYKGVANSANRLAKLDLTTGAIDTVFSPVGATSNGFNNNVYEFATSGTSLYVGGAFTAYKGVANSANRLAKLDLTTGAIDTVFSPVGATSNGFNGIVNALTISGTSLYAGGSFTAYKGIANSANYIAKLDPTTGAIDTTFSPAGINSNGFNYYVYSFLVSGSNLYVGGIFNTYRGTQNAKYLVPLDLSTGVLLDP